MVDYPRMRRRFGLHYRLRIPCACSYFFSIASGTIPNPEDSLQQISVTITRLKFHEYRQYELEHFSSTLLRSMALAAVLLYGMLAIAPLALELSPGARSRFFYWWRISLAVLVGFPMLLLVCPFLIEIIRGT